MNKAAILGIVRHALTTAGGALVAQGIVDDQQIVTEAIGVLVAIIGLVWSIIDKRGKQKPESGNP